MSTTPLTIYSPNIVHVGLIGKRNSGKSSAAGFFKYYFSDWYLYRVGFSKEIKLKLAELTEGNVEAIEKNKSDPFLRYLLQALGEALRRDAPRHLIEACKIHIEYELNKNDNKLDDKIMVIYEDVRLPIEADYIKAAGGRDRSFIILVERGLPIPNLRKDAPVVQAQRSIDIEIDRHETETAFNRIGWDHVINNDQTLDFLHKQVGYASEYITKQLKKVKYGQH